MRPHIHNVFYTEFESCENVLYGFLTPPLWKEKQTHFIKDMTFN